MQSSNQSSRRHAFTLIELLIVVAIIAILAAIAVPNFMEAQVRAKVSRVKNDMRAMATAIETYRLDTNKYPVDVLQYEYILSMRPNGWTHISNYRVLTTPIAYLSSIPLDTFHIKPKFVPDPAYWYFAYMCYDESYFKTNAAFTTNPFYQDGTWANEGVRMNWVMYSVGPDMTQTGANYYPYTCAYDSTNGTISNGDIVRWGRNHCGRWNRKPIGMNG